MVPRSCWSTVYAIDRRGRGASGDHGRYDVEREFEDVAAAIPGARVQSLPGQGHTADVVAPAQVAEHVLAFLAR